MHVDSEDVYATRFPGLCWGGVIYALVCNMSQAEMMTMQQHRRRGLGLITVIKCFKHTLVLLGDSVKESVKGE